MIVWNMEISYCNGQYISKWYAANYLQIICVSFFFKASELSADHGKWVCRSMGLVKLTEWQYCEWEKGQGCQHGEYPNHWYLVFNIFQPYWGESLTVQLLKTEETGILVKSTIQSSLSRVNGNFLTYL